MSRVSNTPAVPVPQPSAESPISPPPASDLRGGGWLRGDRLLLGAFAVCALLIGYQMAVTLLQPPWIGVVTDWLRTVLAWLALLVVGYVAWWTSRAHRPDAPAWWFCAAALLSYAIALTMWTVEDAFIYPHGVPFPILSDLFFALQYPFFFVATILIPRRRPSTSRLVMILDCLLWMGAAFTLSWFFILTPIFTENDLSPLAKEVIFSYPVGDLFVLLGLTVTLLRPSYSRAHAPVVGILFVAFACLIVGDSWATHTVLQPAHVYLAGAMSDLFWLIAYLLFPLSALVQLRITQRELAVNGDMARQNPDHEDLLWRDIKASLPLFLPIVAALASSAAITIGAIVRAGEMGWRAEVWHITVVFALLLLVIVRQAIICLELSSSRREMAVAQVKEQALHELDRRKNEFLGVVSHEIRTPLTSLQGYIQLLIRRIDAWRRQEDGAAGTTGLAQKFALASTMLGYCQESLRRLTRLADDLVDDVRIRDGRLTLRRVPCDLVAIVRTAVEEQRVLEPDRAIILKSPPIGSVPVVADAERIGQVVTNYLTNALKYSKEDRPVAVRLEVEGEACGEGAADDLPRGLACVLVRDDGPGLSLADQAHVWERFPQIGGVVVQSGSGVSLGIGLHIARAIVEAHGGRVGVVSAPGQGATFWFTLPLAPPSD